ncbi:MAG: TraB/GumN family protein, partial [Bacteroidota bacterium]
DRVFDKIERCEAFATELNLEEANASLDANALDLEEGLSLDQLLTKQQYRKVKKSLLKTTGLNLKLFHHNHPIVVANMMADVVLSKDMPFSLDQTLWNYAKSLGKIALGIETLEEQIQTMRQIPLDYQLKSLVGTAKNLNKLRKQTLKMAQLYETADIQRIFKSARKSMGGIRKIMLYDRNGIMADRIALLASEQSLCCAIGAAHLGGKKGVLRLLKKKGFRVKPAK